MALDQIACKETNMSVRCSFVVLVLGSAVLLGTLGQIQPAHGAPLRFQENVDQAQVLAETAMNAQNNSNYEFAAKQWEKLVAEHGDSPLVGKAHYYAGFCYSQINEFRKSIDQFKLAIPKLADDQAVLKPQANLFLGFAQYRLGQQLMDQEPTRAESETLLTTATQTFANLLSTYPNFADADQVCYFQGGAFEELKRLEDALNSYAKMLTYKKQTFKFEGLYALADVCAQLGQHAKALEHYEKFRAEATAIGGNPLLNDVKFRTGRTLINLAIADENSGNRAKSKTRFTEAEKILSQVANLDPAGQDKSFLELTDDARFQQAYCLRRLGQFEQAAQLYEQVSTRADSPLAAQSLAYAGRSWIDAGNPEKAVAALQKSVATDSSFAGESAHWLAGIYLKSDPAKAYDLASQWVAKSAPPLVVSLLMDQADAAYAISDRKSESVGLFMAIADKYSEHPLAPTALYNAAFAALELNDFSSAIEKASQFESKYASNDFLPDALEVKADACLLNDQPDIAGEVFQKLVSRFPEHSKNTLWKLRLGLTLHLEKKYQEAIDVLNPLADSFSQPAKKAEVLHWIGSSQFQLKDYANAAASLSNSNATDSQWRRADETLLTLCRAQLALDQSEPGKAAAEKLITGFPNSTLLSEAYYHLGEHAYDKKQYKEALGNFEKIYKNDRESKFAPHSLYAAAWSQLELQAYAESEKLFSDLIKNFPDHELAKSAKIGRGATRRKTGDLDSSIADLQAFLKTNPEGQPRLNALYEIGLAQVETQKWDDAIATFKQLIAESPTSPRADRFHYELAWAYRAKKNEPEAIKYFEEIIKSTPNSPLAAEAHFHVGTVAYDNKDYDTAIKSYQLCVNSETADNIREKAAYKLAWAYYKQDQFDKALAGFENQAKQFPNGDLYADGMFMIAESQYRLKNHDQAYQSYVAAKPAVDASGNIEPKIKWLTILHGAQSANKVKKYQEAIDLASAMSESDADLSFKQDAWLELGNAYNGLKQRDQALDNFRKASKNLGKTGARAHCMIGDLLFLEKKFEEAVDEYKLVYFGYGGPQAAADVKPWQAYAIYEAARCSFVQVDKAPDQLKPKLIAEAIKQFEYLLQNYADDRLAAEAKKQLAKLKELDSQ